MITSQFNKVKRSQYGTSTDFKQDNVEYIGNNCYIPSSGNCFIKCAKDFTEKYTEDFLNFIRTEKCRSRVMTSAINQPFCRKHNTNLGYFNGTEVRPRKNTERNTALKLHKNHFCLI